MNFVDGDIHTGSVVAAGSTVAGIGEGRHGDEPERGADHGGKHHSIHDLHENWSFLFVCWGGHDPDIGRNAAEGVPGDPPVCIHPSQRSGLIQCVTIFPGGACSAPR